MRNSKIIFLVFCVCLTFVSANAQHNYHEDGKAKIVSGNGNSSAEAGKSNAKIAHSTFARLKKLAGKWKGRSTKGWEEDVSYKVIARGTVLVVNSFDAHPNETMMTMYHMDGDRLMLTHYCVAKNQPRLVATSFSADGNTVTFTFKDATNIPSRDKGHMDKLILTFIDENTIKSRWSWYSNGKESFMETIKLTRIKERSKQEAIR